MPDRVIVAVHDPRGTLSEAQLRARVRAGLVAEADPTVVVAGALGFGWTGPTTAEHEAGLVIDGAWAGPAEALLGDWADVAPRLRAARGGFALLAWDGVAGRGLVARDHLGARPLFWVRAGSMTYLASEVAPLLAALPQRPAPDAAEIGRWLSGGRPLPGRTLYAGVGRFPAAHALLLGPSGVELRRYWRARPRPGLAALDRAAAAQAIREALATAVQPALASARAPGVLLSGGLDSSAVLAVAADQRRDDPRAAPLSALTGVFDAHPELDEGTFARSAAERCSATHVTVPLADGPVAPYADAYLARWSLPLEYGSSALFAPLHEVAAELGIDVLLDGEGGDELFGCEPFLIVDRLLARDPTEALRITRELPGLERLRPRALRVVARRWVLPAIVPRRSPWWRAGEPRWQAHLAWTLTEGREALGVQDHLRRTAALAGLRDAHPLLDVDLVELMLSLPPELAFDRRLDRPLLREAMRDRLPRDVRLREDKPFFNAPFVAALQGPDRAQIDAILTAGALELGAHTDTAQLVAAWQRGPDASLFGPARWASRMWRAFALESWLRREAGRWAGASTPSPFPRLDPSGAAT